MTAEQYAALAAQLPSDALASVRAKGAAALIASGFPGRRDEAWKYTRVAPFLEAAYAPATSVRVPTLPPANGPRLVLVDGLVHEPIAATEGLTVRPLDGRDVADVDVTGFRALNHAFLRSGVHVAVAAGASVTLEIVCVASGANTLGTPCTRVAVGAGATLVLVERFVGAGGAALTSAEIHVDVGVDARVDHVRLAAEPLAVAHVGYVGARLEDRSTYALVSVLAGAGTSRVELHVTTLGAAYAELSGLAMLRRQQHGDHHVTIDHAGPAGRSVQRFRSLLDGSARGVFTGRVIVREGAIGTDAAQVHRALLLSSDAVVNARPQLEIRTDDVKCTHGAAIGALDEEALFYLRQRGLDPLEARALLTAAFASEILSATPLSLRGELDERLKSWLSEA